MRILADQNLANIDTLLRGIGEITLLPGREINAASARHFDALLVRSITRVDAELLAGSSLRFVGTATSGLDHIDLAYLAQHNIALAHAAGSNAEAVVDYCLTAMGHCGVFTRFTQPVVGIVGFGQVGSRLHRRLSAMGITSMLCDPPVRDSLLHNHAAAAESFVPLDNLIDCDVVSLHVPLSTTGPHATAALIDRDFLSAMRREALLINSCRGGVVDEQALLSVLAGGAGPHCAFDVWSNEPAANSELVSRVDVATPHIAGYSARAKRTASEMIVAQLKEFIGSECTAQSDLLQLDHAALLHKPHGQLPDARQGLLSALQQTLDLKHLSAHFKEAVREAGSKGLSAKAFDGFRNDLRNRREFSEMTGVVRGEGLEEGSEQALLHAAGFTAR